MGLEFALLQGIQANLPLCCIVAYFLGGVKHQPVWKERLKQFRIQYEPRLPSPDEIFDATIQHVPCPICMKKLLATTYGL